jgi:hypothetical protein
MAHRTLAYHKGDVEAEARNYPHLRYLCVAFSCEKWPCPDLTAHRELQTLVVGGGVTGVYPPLRLPKTLVQLHFNGKVRRFPFPIDQCSLYLQDHESDLKAFGGCLRHPRNIFPVLVYQASGRDAVDAHRVSQCFTANATRALVIQTLREDPDAEYPEGAGRTGALAPTLSHLVLDSRIATLYAILSFSWGHLSSWPMQLQFLWVQLHPFGDEDEDGIVARKTFHFFFESLLSARVSLYLSHQPTRSMRQILWDIFDAFLVCERVVIFPCREDPDSFVIWNEWLLRQPECTKTSAPLPDEAFYTYGKTQILLCKSPLPLDTHKFFYSVTA